MTELQIRGAASPEEIAAVVAVLTSRQAAERLGPLAAWRRQRRLALRPGQPAENGWRSTPAIGTLTV